MELRTDTCARCGAPMHVGAPGAVETCRFCGAEARADGPGLDAAPVPPENGSAGTAGDPAPLDLRQRGKRGVDVSGIVGACIAVAVIGGGVLAVARNRPGSPSSSALALGELGRTNLDETWHPFTGSTQVVGSYESVDPVANLACAQTIAAAWRPDASPFAMQGTCMSKDGTTDLTGSRGCAAWIEYWFASRACQATSTTQCGFAVQIVGAGGKAASAAVPSIRVAAVPVTTAAAIQRPGCPLSRAIAALGQGVLENASDYEVHLDGGKWTIYGGSRGRMGVVDAMTCAIVSR